MKERLLIVGCGGLGRVVHEIAEQTYECSFLDDGYEIGTNINGATVIGKTSEIKQFFPAFKMLIVAIGNNKLRERIYKEAKLIGYSFSNIIWPSAYISPFATIGDGCILLNNSVIQNSAIVGDGTILCSGAEAHHDSHIGNYCVIYTNSAIRSLTTVGDRVWIGSTVSVSTGATVPDDAVSEDGSVFRKKEE